MNINRVELSGNLVRTAEVKATTSGSHLASFTVAVGEGFGEKRRTNYIDCVKWLGKEPSAAELSFWQGLERGRHVSVAGRFRQRTLESDGQKRSKIEVIVDEMDAGPNPSAQGQSQQLYRPQQQAAQNQPQQEMFGEDIKF